VKILDLSAGNRAIWFDKNYRDAVFLDIRAQVYPDIIGDSTKLPPVGEEFDLIVFDPPHANYGANGYMAETYGHFTLAQIRATIEGTAREAHRVAREDGLMAFKWHNHDLLLKTVLELLIPYWEPLFGHGVATSQRRKHMTSWVMLRKRAR
jgi:tRNA1(Val) A37 N6-methylase TrmN6